MNKILYVVILLALAVSIVFNIVQFSQIRSIRRNNNAIEKMLGFNPENFQKEVDANKEEQKKNELLVKIKFSNNETEQNILAFKSILDARTEVARVEYISASQELNTFKDKSNDDLTTKALSGLEENPYGGVLIITLKNISGKVSIAELIETSKQYKIDSVIY